MKRDSDSDDNDDDGGSVPVASPAILGANFSTMDAQKTSLCHNILLSIVSSTRRQEAKLLHF